MANPSPNDTAESLAIKALGAEIQALNHSLASAIEFLPRAITAIDQLTAEIHRLRDYMPTVTEPVVNSIKEMRQYLMNLGR